MWIRETRIRGQEARYEFVERSGNSRDEYLRDVTQARLKLLASQGVEIPYPGWTVGRPVPPKATWVVEGL